MPSHGILQQHDPSLEMRRVIVVKPCNRPKLRQIPISLVRSWFSTRRHADEQGIVQDGFQTIA